MTLPFSNISPPQTPHGSPRSTAPARHGRRSGHVSHDALASSRSAGRSENHSCVLSLQGNGSPRSAARLASVASEELVMSLHPREADSVPLMGFPENPYMQILHHATPAGIARSADIASVTTKTHPAVTPRPSS